MPLIDAHRTQARIQSALLHLIPVLFDGGECVDVDLTTDSERRRKEYEDGLRQRGDGGNRQEGERQKETDDGGTQQEEQQQQSTWRQGHVTQKRQDQEEKDTSEGRVGSEELIKTVELRMRQEEMQERVSGEEEARRESEGRWEIGKGKGSKRERVTGPEKERRTGRAPRQEGKGRRSARPGGWEEWWRAKEEGWMSEQ